jgi:tetratricopeptide (TPR) repeat protein
MSPELAHQLTAMDPAALGARIKAARIAAGLTQPELAGTDASVAYLSRIESGQRRPSVELLGSLAARLGVQLEYLVLGDTWEDGQRLELLLDHAELSLVGGEAEQALARAREALNSPGLDTVPGGAVRARYVEAAALDTMGDAGASAAFQLVLQGRPDSVTRLKSATALCRIWREQGQLERAIACAQAELDSQPAEVLGSEEGIRLSVTLAAALFVAGRTIEAAELCDRAIAESERLSSPVARASAYWNASMIRAEAGDVSEALSMAKRALHLLESTERVRDIGRLRTQMVAIMLEADPPRLEDAQEQLRVADTELDWSAATPVDRARHEFVNARAHFMAGEIDLARDRAVTVLDSTATEMPLLSVDALTLLGQIAWAEGDRDEAHAWYRRAIATLTGVGADREAAQVWFQLGTLASQAGLVEESADAFRRAAVSTGLRARLPVVTPPSSIPRTTPHAVPVGRMPVIGTPPVSSPRTTPSQAPSGRV